jgi:hypothetical protein
VANTNKYNTNSLVYSECKESYNPKFEDHDIKEAHSKKELHVKVFSWTVKDLKELFFVCMFPVGLENDSVW